jgi:hypothetical protein
LPPYRFLDAGHSPNALLLGFGSEPAADVVRAAACPHGGPEALWFSFTLVRTGAPAKPVLRIVLAHAGNMLGFGDPQAARLVSRVEGRVWERTGPGRRLDAADGQLHAAWEVPAPAGRIDLAFCFPYSQPELDLLIGETGGRLRSDAIGLSQGGRPLVRVSNAYGRRGGDAPGLYVVARQHSGETPASWVLDGLLRRVVALGDGAPLVWAVPFANADGVALGDYGKDSFPIDMNRAWGKPPMRHETLAIKADIGRWRERCRPVLILDLHAPGACETSGCYFFLPRGPLDDAAARRVEEAARGLASALGPYASADAVRRGTYASRWELPTLATAACTEFGTCGLSLETSYQRAGDTVLTIEHYREAGARLIDGFLAMAGSGAYAST